MSDFCLHMNALLDKDPLRARSRSYAIHEVRDGFYAVDAWHRAGPDWNYARAWFQGTRQLYAFLTRLEASGYRLQVSRKVPVARTAAEFAMTETMPRASEFLAQLNEGERDLHAQLFPEEARLIADGYDWDDQAVYRFGQPIQKNNLGLTVENTPGGIYEWVRIADEATWRRYPILVVA